MSSRTWPKTALIVTLFNLIIVGVSLINKFPEGHVFAGADVYQAFNPSVILSKYSFVWDTVGGLGSFLAYYGYNLFYLFLFAVSGLFSISPSEQSVLYYLIFYLGSYWSFFSSGLLLENRLRKGQDDMKDNSKNNSAFLAVVSFAYAFNLYTFYAFHYTWNFSPFLYLYMLIPLIFTLTYRFFTDNKVNYKTLSFLSLTLCLANIPNSNFPFFIALCLLIGSFYILLVSSKSVSNTFKKTILFGVTYVLSTIWAVLPQVPEIMMKATEIQVDTHTGESLLSWILWQAVFLKDILFMTGNLNAYVTALSVPAYLSITFIILAFIGVKLTNSGSQHNKLKIVTLGLLLITVFLVNKGKGWLPVYFTEKIFSNVILGSIRSTDKTLLYLPFFTLLLIYLGFRSKTKELWYCTILIVATALATSYPVFLGWMQTRVSVAFGTRQTYKDSEYAYLHRIPEDYSVAARMTNSEKRTTRIMSFPFNAINSVAWINYPKWQLVGIDPTMQLFNKTVISMNSTYGSSPTGYWDYGSYWRDNYDSESLWFIKLLSLLNVDFLIYHNDVAPRFVEETIDKVVSYENQGYINALYKGDYLSVYKLNERYVLPGIYSPDNTYYIHSRIDNGYPVLSMDPLLSQSQLYFDGEITNTIIESGSNAMLIPGTRLNSNLAWAPGWAWPNSRIAPDSPLYRLVQLKESRTIASEKDPIQKADLLLWLGTKRLGEVLSYDLDNSRMEKLINEALALYSEGFNILQNNNIDKKKNSYSRQDMLLKLYMYYGRGLNQLANTGQKVPDNLLDRMKDFYNTLYKWMHTNEKFSCSDCYNFSVPESNRYEVLTNECESGWKEQGEVDAQKGDQVMSLGSITEPQSTKVLYSAEDLEKEKFPILIRIANWEPKKRIQITSHYRISNGALKIQLVEDFTSSDTYYSTPESKDKSTKRKALLEQTLLPLEYCPDDTSNCYSYYKAEIGSHVSGKTAYLLIDLPVGNYTKANLKIKDLQITQQCPVNATLRKINPNGSAKNDLKVTFTRVNPTKYVVKVSNASKPYYLVLNEGYHKMWKLSLLNQPVTNALSKLGNWLCIDPNRLDVKNTFTYLNGAVLENTLEHASPHYGMLESLCTKPAFAATHYAANGYANGWYIDPEAMKLPLEHEFIIEYSPQQLYYISALITGTTALTSIVIIIYLIFRHARS